MLIILTYPIFDHDVYLCLLKFSLNSLTFCSFQLRDLTHIFLFIYLILNLRKLLQLLILIFFSFVFSACTNVSEENTDTWAHSFPLHHFYFYSYVSNWRGIVLKVTLDSVRNHKRCFRHLTTNFHVLSPKRAFYF